VVVPRVLVIGSGVAGLAAASALHRRGVQVTLAERDERLGGHAHTVHVQERDGQGQGVDVDVGFMVLNGGQAAHCVAMLVPTLDCSILTS